MEQLIDIGDSQLFTYEFQNKKEVELVGVQFVNYIHEDSAAIISCEEVCKLSQEELCTFIKLLISHLELPMEFI